MGQIDRVTGHGINEVKSASVNSSMFSLYRSPTSYQDEDKNARSSKKTYRVSLGNLFLAKRLLKNDG